MTAIDLDARPDLQGVISEVEAIGLAATSEWKKVDPDLFVEKVLTEAGYDYDWSDEKLKGTIRTPRLIDLSIGYKPRDRELKSIGPVNEMRELIERTLAESWATCHCKSGSNCATSAGMRTTQAAITADRYRPAFVTLSP
ncbi:hypothetical protein [Frigidibacter mobilis]|uniref:hypothetical protein n=1 Tax=Frigidibacter mobilis TaxID=1335048 RepID=UPI00082F013E|nr:hypothetical protein [Frigidibacter mobilis]